MGSDSTTSPCWTLVALRTGRLSAPLRVLQWDSSEARELFARGQKGAFYVPSWRVEHNALTAAAIPVSSPPTSKMILIEQSHLIHQR